MDISGRDLELRVTVAGADPLRGSVRLSEGDRREFWGWLELAELITQACDDAGDAPAVDGSPALD
ncbi:MAG: hypothetical protein WAK93_17030 [Solirubrobacteraceae bacterium]